jgi:tetratricopeptide (TPR) repeat protein/TolB-like protein/tRNA A-37 threonylcarbamoyl transferase component Bud32
MIGQTVSHYKIIAKIAQGGMGVIYKASDTKLKRTVALKFLPPDITRDATSKQRFIHEARSASILDHPNICTIYEIDETDNGQMFIAMAYYEGETIKEKIESGSITIESALDIMVQICDGLSRSHEAGIVHRDIKPANIMVTRRGEVKILDFGLAKLGGESSLTRTGIAVGTAAYMSPEQASGEEVDFRTDIWSLGVMLYEIAARKLPFHGDTPRSMVNSIIRDDPSGNSELEIRLPRKLMKIISKCMKKRAGDRYQSMAELRNDLVGFSNLHGRDKHTVKIDTGFSGDVRPRKRPGVVIPLLLVAMVLGLLLVIPKTRNVIMGWVGMNSFPQQKRVAVIPFTAEGNDPAARLFGNGLTRVITDKLIALEKYEGHLWTVPNRMVLEENINSFAKARMILGSNLVLTGKIQRDMNRIRLHVRLLNSETGKVIRSNDFDAHITNLSMWQDRVVMTILDFLEIEMDSKKQTLLNSGGTSFPGAFIFYMKSLGYLGQTGDPDRLVRSIRLLDQAIEQDGLYADALIARGEVCFNNFGRTRNREWLDRSESDLRRALQTNPDSWTGCMMLGKVYREKGLFDQSLGQLEQAVKLNPNGYRAYLETAFTYEDAGSLYKAEESYKKTIDIRPDHWKGYDYLAYFYYKAGRLNEAETMYMKTIRMNPYHIQAYNNLIAIYNQKGNNRRAWEVFENVTELSPNSTAYSNIGNNLFFQGKYEAAKNMYEKAVELGRNDRRIWGNLADSYRYLRTHKSRALEVYRKAIELAERSLERDPGNAGLRSSLALYLSKMGDHDNAISQINRALSAEPNRLDIIYNSILVFEISNRRTDALHAVKAYVARQGALARLEKDPDLDPLRRDRRYRQALNKEDYAP